MTTPEQQRRINDLNAVTCLMSGRDEVYASFGDGPYDEDTADGLIEALEQFAYPLTEWLVERCGCHDVDAVTVQIGSVTYQGARYKQTLNCAPMSCEPQVKTYEREAMYLLGELPASHRRSRRTAYVFEGEEHEWYVASWVPVEVATSDEFGRFHYGQGPHFLLMPWTAPGKIDEHEETPYRRVEAVLIDG